MKNTLEGRQQGPNGFIGPSKALRHTEFRHQHHNHQVVTALIAVRPFLVNAKTISMPRRCANQTPQRLITHWGIHGNRCSWAESGVFGCASQKVADTSISDPLHTVSPNVTARCRGTHIRLVEGSLVVRSGSSPPDDAMAVCFLAWPELVLVNFGQVW